MERENVQNLLAMMQATYLNFKPENKTEAVNAWFMALEDYPTEIVMAAFKTYIQINKSGFAPAPGQLIELMHMMSEKQDLNEQEAWAMVRKAISRSGYYYQEEFEKLPPTIQKAVGRPEQLRAWALDEEYNEGVVSSHFINCYKTELKRANEISKMPQAIRERIEMLNQQTEERNSFPERSNIVYMQDRIPEPDDAMDRVEEIWRKRG